MERFYFNEDELNNLKQNSYVKSVTQKSISFTKEFKEHFIAETNKGKGPTRIFIESGFNPYVLGNIRIQEFSKRVKRKINCNKPLDDNRGKKSTGRPKKIKEVVYQSKDDEIEALKHKNLVLEQENEFLKKIISLTQSGH